MARPRGDMAALIERLAAERGVRVLGVKAPGEPEPERAPEIEAGTVVADFVVEGRPVPWKAPTTTRTGHAYKDPRLVAWQSAVRDRAAAAMAGRPAHAGPVELRLAFTLTSRPGVPPDLSNLVKGCEDALQGPVIVNDRCVQRITSSRSPGAADRVVVVVVALGP